MVVYVKGYQGVDESRKEVNPRRQEALLPSWDLQLNIGALTESQCEWKIKTHATLTWPAWRYNAVTLLQESQDVCQIQADDLK